MSHASAVKAFTIRALAEARGWPVGRAAAVAELLIEQGVVRPDGPWLVYVDDERAELDERVADAVREAMEGLDL